MVDELSGQRRKIILVHKSYPEFAYPAIDLQTINPEWELILFLAVTESAKQMEALILAGILDEGMPLELLSVSIANPGRIPWALRA